MANQTNSKAMPATRSQGLATKARACINSRASSADYLSFARRFPSLVHSCGLAQALAFAESKKQIDYLSDLKEVVANSELLAKSTDSELGEYLLLTRMCVDAASWIKRYSEAKMAPMEEIIGNES